MIDDGFKYPLGIVTKKELRIMYGFSRETLRKLLNEKYFDQLLQFDYSKTSHHLSPRAFRFFVQSYGTPDGKIPDPS